MFISIAIIIVLILVWAINNPSEEKYAEKLEQRAQRDLFGKTYVQKNLRDTFELQKDQYIYVCGLNHQKTLGLYWEFKIFSNNVFVKKITPDVVNPNPDMFWSVEIAGYNRENAICVPGAITVAEIIYSQRPGLLFPKIYVVQK